MSRRLAPCRSPIRSSRLGPWLLVGALVVALGVGGLALAASDGATTNHPVKIKKTGPSAKVEPLGKVNVSDAIPNSSGTPLEAAQAPTAQSAPTPAKGSALAGVARSAKNAAMAVPSNDDCTTPVVIPAGSYPYVTAPVDITDATPQSPTADPFFACGTPDRTVWFSFTPTQTGAYLISTCNSRGATGSTVFDTVIAVDDACPPTLSLACNDTDTGCSTGDQSTVTVVLQNGVTYYIGAGRYSGPGETPVAPGSENIAVLVDIIPAPANDNCSAPGVLTLNRATAGTTASANDDNQSPATAACYAGNGQTPTTSAGRDVVYSFTAPAAGSYSFRQFDDVVAGALRSQDVSLYVSDSCPASGTVNCLLGANRMPPPGALTSVQNRAEEVYCLPMTAGQKVYVWVDNATAGNDGGAFQIEVFPCNNEVETNNTPGTATAYSACFEEGSLPPPAGSDVDFWDIGTVAAGDKIFAFVDAQAANNNDFTLRVTTATDTLEVDANDGSSAIGSNAPVISGTPGTGVATYLRVSQAATSSEPYHLFRTIRPGPGAAQVESEPNNGFFSANPTATGYTTGTLDASTGDCFRFVVNVGDEISVQADGDVTRDGTANCPGPNIYDVNGGILGTFGAAACTSNLTPSPGTLVGATPTAPGEGFQYRARYTGPYWVCYFANTGSGDWLGSIALNCGPIPPRSADITVTKTGPVGAVATSSQFDYTITITNNGPDVAQDIRLQDTLDPNLLFVGLSVLATDNLPGNVVCSSLPPAGTNANPIDCTNYSMSAGSTTTYTLRVQVKGCIGSGVPISNTATVTSFTPDPTTPNTSTWPNVTVDDGSCSDFDACTTGDHCAAGACVTTGTLDCEDNNPCTADSCDPAIGCVNDPSPGQGCNDGIPCHQVGLCDPNQPGADPGTGCYFPDNCDHSNTCVVGECDTVNTGQCIYTNQPDGTVCNQDGNACTTGGICTAGVCGSESGTLDCDDHNPCTDDSCNPATGCVHTNNSSTCDDGNACTLGDTCSGGACQPGVGVLNCDDNNACTNDSCDPILGCQHANNSNPCDDGNACTIGDACGGGSCQPGAGSPNCNDGNPCTDDFCVPASGCGHSNNTAPCNDGNACTIGDTCGGGSCQPGAGSPNCNDNNPCTTDSCNPGSGCVNTPNPGAPCSDGNACTTADTCNNTGSCVGGPALNCNDNNSCTADSCNPATGCVNAPVPNGTSCNDGDLCTTNDKCQNGQCVGTSHANNPRPKSVGYYQDLCRHPNHGDSLTQADVDCVNDVPNFADVTTVAQLCSHLNGDHQHRGHDSEHSSDDHDSDCRQADRELLAFALNRCRARVCDSSHIQSHCGNHTNTTVGQNFAQASALILDEAHRTKAQCELSRCLSHEINVGQAFRIHDHHCNRHGNHGSHMFWEQPYYGDGETTTATSFEIYRVAVNDPVDTFTKIGTTTALTFDDDTIGDFQYEVVAVAPEY